MTTHLIIMFKGTMSDVSAFLVTEAGKESPFFIQVREQGRFWCHSMIT